MRGGRPVQASRAPITCLLLLLHIAIDELALRGVVLTCNINIGLLIIKHDSNCCILASIKEVYSWSIIANSLE